MGGKPFFYRDWLQSNWREKEVCPLLVVPWVAASSCLAQGRSQTLWHSRRRRANRGDNISRDNVFIIRRGLCSKPCPSAFLVTAKWRADCCPSICVHRMDCLCQTLDGSYPIRLKDAETIFFNHMFKKISLGSNLIYDIAIMEYNVNEMTMTVLLSIVYSYIYSICMKCIYSIL